jgi:hypothetical protein
MCESGAAGEAGLQLPADGLCHHRHPGPAGNYMGFILAEMQNLQRRQFPAERALVNSAHPQKKEQRQQRAWRM